ncbi:MAG TPA: hypothetical protein VNY05_12320 [Candidatus Acidoferrales bacterium]|jgi:hypothetical protein|nr:hypothetical protein [Candidatus Acidoferrales bacterium]
MTDLDSAMTTPKAARANTPAAVTSEIADLNNNLENDYLTAFNNRLLSWTACGITDKKSAPKPPKGFRGGIHGAGILPTKSAAPHPQRPHGRHDAGRLPVAGAVKPREADRRTCAVASGSMEIAGDAKVPGKPGKG